MGETMVLMSAYNQLNREEVIPSLEIYTETELSERWAFSALTSVSAPYSEAYVGPVWRANEYFSFGLSVGLETDPDLWRAAASALYLRKGFEGLIVLEEGGSGLWYRVDLTERVKWLRFGLLSRRYAGVGASLGVTHKGFELWAAPLYDPEAKLPNLLAVLSWTP